MARPTASWGKSWASTNSALWPQTRPLFLKLPTTSDYSSDRRPCAARQVPESALRAPDLFFGGLLASAGPSLAVKCQIGEAGLDFTATTPDGFCIQAADDRQLPLRRAVRRLGKRADIPAALRFGQASQQLTDLVMIMHHLGCQAGLTHAARTRHHVRRIVCGHQLLSSV